MNEKTYGFIQVVKKDGSDGGSCPILGDTTFGRWEKHTHDIVEAFHSPHDSFVLQCRDKEADVRIKLPQVSKQQAIIKVDENGKPYVVNLSKTNATIVNGRSIENVECTYLNHGDEIMMGERIFLFKLGGSISLSSSSILLLFRITYQLYASPSNFVHLYYSSRGHVCK